MAGQQTAGPDRVDASEGAGCYAIHRLPSSEPAMRGAMTMRVLRGINYDNSTPSGGSQRLFLKTIHDHSRNLLDRAIVVPYNLHG
jgi:hypothetical protein